MVPAGQEKIYKMPLEHLLNFVQSVDTAVKSVAEVHCVVVSKIISLYLNSTRNKLYLIDKLHEEQLVVVPVTQDLDEAEKTVPVGHE